MSSILLRLVRPGVPGLVALLAGLASGPARAAGPNETPIAFCFLSARAGGCVCSVEAIEEVVSEAQYRAQLRQLHRAGMLSRTELADLEGSPQRACAAPRPASTAALAPRPAAAEPAR